MRTSPLPTGHRGRTTEWPSRRHRRALTGSPRGGSQRTTLGRRTARLVRARSRDLRHVRDLLRPDGVRDAGREDEDQLRHLRRHAGHSAGPGHASSLMSIVGIPLARLVDIFPRKYVLSARHRRARHDHGARRPRAELRPARRLRACSSARPVRRTGRAPIRSWSTTSARRASRWSSRSCSSASSSARRSGPSLGGRADRAGPIRWPDKTSFLGIEIFNWQLVLVIVGAPGLLAGAALSLIGQGAAPPQPARSVAPDAACRAPLGRKFAAFMGWDAAQGDLGAQARVPAAVRRAGACRRSRARALVRVARAVHPAHLRGWDEAQHRRACSDFDAAARDAGRHHRRAASSSPGSASATRTPTSARRRSSSPAPRSRPSPCR